MKKTQHIKLFENFSNPITLKSLTNNLKKIDIDACKELLHDSSKFYKIFYHNLIVCKKNERKAEELANKFGLPELMGHWIYPFNESYILNEYLLLSISELIKETKINESEITKLYKIYLTLNPSISTIPVKNWWDRYTVMMGMTSSFNYDDIYDFLTLGGFSDRKKNVVYLSKSEEVESFLRPHHIGYVPSEKSLDEILKRIYEK